MSDWLPLLALIAAAATLHVFMAFVWPRIRRRLAGAREPWALRHGYVPQSADEVNAYLDAYGRPGLFSSHRGGRVEFGMRGAGILLVDYSFLVARGDERGGTWTVRRQVTVAIGAVGAAVPRVRVQPRGLSGWLAESMFLQRVRTDDAAFDRAWQLSGWPPAARPVPSPATNVTAALRDAFAVDEPAVRELLSPRVRAALSKYPGNSYDFDQGQLLVFRPWRLLPNRELAALVGAWTEVSGAAQANR